jgi:hypothetical protein
MKINKILNTVFILLFCSGIALSQELSKVGTTAAPFLQFGAGSRAAGMGETFTAIANNAEAIYWNPSGIDTYSENDATFHYSDWFAGMSYWFGGAVLHIEGVGSFGVSALSLSTPNMEVTTVEFPDGEGSNFDAADLCLGVSYAKMLTDRFSFGLTAKYISRRIWHMSADAVAFDLGVIYTLPWEKMKLGMALLNIGSKLQMQGTDAYAYVDLDESVTGNNTQILAALRTKEWALPMSIRFGLSYQVFENEMHELLIAGDYIHPNDNFSSVNLGAEYGFKDLFFIRAGYKDLMLDEATQGLTFGGGIHYSLVTFDYSYIETDYLDYVQQFSVNIKF